MQPKQDWHFQVLALDQAHSNLHLHLPADDLDQVLPSYLHLHLLEVAPG
jgi:hypothetical protein